MLAAAAAAGDHRSRSASTARAGSTSAAWTDRGRAAGGSRAACLQVANHEVGTLQPYAEAAEAAARAGVPLVLDATAALGRIDLRALPARGAS